MLVICRKSINMEKRLGFEGYTFAQPISVSQKRSSLSVLLAPLMLTTIIILFVAVNTNF